MKNLIAVLTGILGLFEIPFLRDGKSHHSGNNLFSEGLFEPRVTGFGGLESAALTSAETEYEAQAQESQGHTVAGYNLHNLQKQGTGRLWGGQLSMGH